MLCEIQRLVAASDERDAFTTFTGSTRLKLGQGPSGAALEGDRVAAMRLSEGEGGQTLMVRSSSDPGLREFSFYPSPLFRQLRLISWKTDPASLAT